jgi:hypothetical protein
MENDPNSAAKTSGVGGPVESALKHDSPAQIPITNDPNTRQKASLESAGPPSKELQTRLTATIADALSSDKNLSVLPDVRQALSEIIQRISAAAVPVPPFPSAETLKIRESFRQAALDAYREEYKELSEVWKGLETKAQGTITIGGIFIAASFTFAKDLSATRLDYYGNLLLGAAIFLLIPSVLLAVLALKTREVSTPPSGEIIEDMVKDLKEVPDADLPDRKRRFIYDQGLLWQTTITTTKQAIEDKEQWLHLSQGLLLIAIVIAGALTLKLLNI